MVARFLESNIAGSVASMEYCKNHHYLRLRDADGHETTMVEHGLVKYRCCACAYVFYSATAEANQCALCGHGQLEMMWTRPQVALVPEKESEFQLLKPCEPA